ncbi:MAG TPA: hypothetical protein VHK88_04370, partial [Aquihabitans sp.]|jgi:hypothetical protein|nr:hypothetical protein [Aquihabitans sp.]
MDLMLRASGSMVVDPAAWPTGCDRALASAQQLRDYAAAEPVNQRAVFITIFEATAPGHPLAPVVRDIIAALHQMFAGFLVDGIADGSVRPDLDPSVETTRIQAQILGIAYDYAAGLGARSFPERIAEQVERMRGRLVPGADDGEAQLDRQR